MQTPQANTFDTLASLGAAIRARRKQLRVSATAAAEAAGLSRVTLHRIERGEPSVAMGLYQRALGALGLRLQLAQDPPAAQPREPAPADGARQATCRVIKQPMAAYGREWLRRRAPPFFPG